jgi:hypothetical protein
MARWNCTGPGGALCVITLLQAPLRAGVAETHLRPCRGGLLGGPNFP